MRSKASKGKKLTIAAPASVSEATHITVDVKIGKHSSIWPGAVIRGDLGQITTGNNAALGDNRVFHAGTLSGESCIIGASCMVSQAMTILDRSFVRGVPAKFIGEVTPEQQQWIEQEMLQSLR